MTVTINGNGTISGVSVGGLPDGVVDEDTLATGLQRVFAHFIYTTQSSVTVATTSAGTQVPITEVKEEHGITGSTGNNNWTHASTGYYHLYIRYRLDTGGDLWTVYGVTKGGSSDAVGVSARTGSGDMAEDGDVLYKVDSTSATYQLQGWCGSGTKDVIDPTEQGKPNWTNYDTLVGITNNEGGLMLDIIISKIGDL